jgi:hypothetical protein
MRTARAKPIGHQDARRTGPARSPRRQGNRAVGTVACVEATVAACAVQINPDTSDA